MVFWQKQYYYFAQMKIIKQWQVHALINAEKKNLFFMLVTHVKYTFFVNNLIRPFHIKTKKKIYIYFWIQKKHFFKEKFLKMRRKHTNITIKTTPLCLSLPTHTCILAMAYIMTKKSLQHSHAIWHQNKDRLQTLILLCSGSLSAFHRAQSNEAAATTWHTNTTTVDSSMLAVIQRWQWMVSNLEMTTAHTTKGQ